MMIKKFIEPLYGSVESFLFVRAMFVGSQNVPGSWGHD